MAAGGLGVTAGCERAVTTPMLMGSAPIAVVMERKVRTAKHARNRIEDEILLSMIDPFREVTT